jgi:hypothetical protein
MQGLRKKKAKKNPPPHNQSSSSIILCNSSPALTEDVPDEPDVDDVRMASNRLKSMSSAGSRRGKYDFWRYPSGTSARSTVPVPEPVPELALCTELDVLLEGGGGGGYV